MSALKVRRQILRLYLLVYLRNSQFVPKMNGTKV
jgi:hypothetical protein